MTISVNANHRIGNITKSLFQSCFFEKDFLVNFVDQISAGSNNSNHERFKCLLFNAILEAEVLLMISLYILSCIYLNMMSCQAIPFYDDYFISETNKKNHEAVGQNKLIPSEYDDVQESDKPTGFTCGLCLVVDEEFSQAFNLKDEDNLKSSMVQFVDHANWIFRLADWNKDGVPDNIGFKIIRISFGWKPFKKEDFEHYETPRNALELLKIFSRLDFRKCCLGVGFTNRPFLNGLDGIAFGASDRLLGGICDHRNPREDYMLNMNTLLVSGRGNNRSQLSTVQVAKTLVHELGHSFGVHAHDNDFKDPECWGFRPDEDSNMRGARPQDGRFIMWTKSSKHPNSPLTNNSLRFSPCSKEAVNSIVSKRKNRQKCFDLEYNPFCGNGLIEGVELCDCGNEFDCAQQECCGSRRSQKPCLIEDLTKCHPSIISRVGGQVNDSEFSACAKIGFNFHSLLLHLVSLLSWQVIQARYIST